MDSTGPDPPQQQQQQQQQPQKSQLHPQSQQPPVPQQQQQQQSQQQPQQPKPQQANQQLPHQHPHQPAQAAPSYPQIPYNHYPSPFHPPRAYTPPYHQHPYYTPYAYGPPPPPHAPWNQPAYPPAPAQSLSNVVNPQPPTNVPQQHKPATQIISPAALGADRPHNQQTLQSAPNQAATLSKGRERKPATLKDPATNKEVPLPNTNTNTNTNITSSLTKSSASTTKQSPNALTATTTTTSVEHVHTLLKKVSELNEIKQQNNEASEEINNDKDSSTKVEASVPENNKQKDISNGKEDGYDSNKDEQEPDKDAKESDKDQEVEEKGGRDEIVKDKVNEKEEIEVKEESSKTKKDEQEEKEEEGGEALVKDDKESSPTKDEKEASNNKDDEQEADTGVSLHYEPWQYNPISNTSGKKIYSIKFLKDVGTKIFKFNLHNESDDKIGLDGNQLQSAFSEKVDMFAPAFSSNSQRYTPTNRQNEPARRQNQHNYAGRSSAGQERQRKVISSASLTQEVELKTSSNPWRPTKDIKEVDPSAAPDDTVETESLKKKFRSILNKLTPNNFENLARTVTDLNIDTESKLGEVIDIVFAKALAEPGYCVLYGQMCSHLKKITAGTANFGNTLLKRCQNQFQSDIYSGLNLTERKDKIEKEEDPEIKKQLNEELYEEMYRCRMRGLGLIKFIGELYKIEMLNDAIMFDCVIRLLSDTSEESLECLCDLLATIGEKLDRSTQKNVEKKVTKSASKANAYQGGQKSAAAVVASGSTPAQQQKVAAEQQASSLKTLDQVFEQLHKIRKNKDSTLSARIKFKLLDTCDLREKDNWLSKNTKDNNPKKIEEIREAHKEKLEQERRQQQNTMGPRRSQEGRRGLGHSGASSSHISSMGGGNSNESGGAGGRGASGMHTSSSSHLLRDHSIGDNNMKSNHNDIETQKEHQRKIESFRNLSVLKSANKTSSSEALRPNSQIYHSALRPVTGASARTGDLRPVTASSISSSGAAATSGSGTTTTSTTPSTTTTTT